MNYFTQILENYEMELIRNYQQTVDRGTKLRFINKRIDNYREIFSPEVYDPKIASLDIEELDAQENFDDIPNTLLYIGFQISILQYIKALDKYEVFANNFHDMLENKAFSRIYATTSLTTNLRNDELLLKNEGVNTYPVHCQCNPRYENINRIRMFLPYVQLIHTFTSNKLYI
uniref:Uncharacterized protein n=1 Tax=Meloidogyne enterolobii TaxID=390850 RepID=A0A6V7TU85_MELEN|nr:unnamed protein product [Meloidogyne enterolobii]